MTEIELKAHIADPDRTERTIRGFATFIKETTKSDTYWKCDGKPEIRSPATGDETDTILAAAMSVFTFVAALAAAILVIAGASPAVAIMICLFAVMFVSASAFLSWKKHSGGKKNRGRNDMAALPVKVRIREEAGITVATYKRKELQGVIEVNDEKEFSIGDRAAFEVLLADLGFSPFIRKEKKTKSFSFRSADGHDVTIELSLVTGLGWFVELEILEDSPDTDTTMRAQDALRATLARCGIAETAIEPRYYTDMLAERWADGGHPVPDAADGAEAGVIRAER